jgi:hypothetical protein
LLKNITTARKSHNELKNSIGKVPKDGWTVPERAKAFLMPESNLKYGVQITATLEEMPHVNVRRQFL